MTYLAATVAIVCFAVGLRSFRVLPAAARAVATSRRAARALRNAALSDEEKEIVSRRYAGALLSTCFSISARGGAAVLVSFVPLLAFDSGGLAPLSSVTAVLTTWQGVALACAIMTLSFFVWSER
jgi:hypothetical protein